MANVLGNSLLKTGVHALRNAESELGMKPKLLIAPGFTSVLPTDGVETIAVGAGGTGYTEAPTVILTGGAGAALAPGR